MSKRTIRVSDATFRAIAHEYGFVCSDEMPLLVVIMEDAPLHDVSAPFCGDPLCPCHNDAAHYEYVEQPILAGLLTPWEGSHLYWGEAI